jgi:3-deoxy-manno-octulosonate cytidylyltransferase (CMP-KDO synthetase)
MIDNNTDYRNYLLNSQMKTAVIIPARYASTRLPRKLLLRETGKPLIQYTYEAALKASLPSSVCIACDHKEIYDTVKSFGGNVVMTNPNAASGTDRIAEVAATMDGVDIIVNVQGDEPELTGAVIDTAVQMLLDHPLAVMSTLATPIRRREQLESPSCVKVVFDKNGRALYFSRSVIPYPRIGSPDDLLQQPLYYQHVGLYAYRRDFLLQLTQLPQAPMEKTESLEQLRVLFQGYDIMVGVIDEATFGIDTPEDYRAFVEKQKLKTKNNTE